MTPPGRWPRPQESAAERAFRERREALSTLLRAAFLAGAELGSRATFGRGLSEEELRGVMAAYPGDLSTRA